MLTYRLYGLRISAEFPIPGCAWDDSGDADVSVARIPKKEMCVRRPATEPLYVSPTVLGVWGSLRGSLHYVFGDGAEFVIESGGQRVIAAWPDEMPVEDALCYLKGPIFGGLLRLRGTVCLHASAILVHGRAIAIAGACGAGKSTTAAWCARSGGTVLTDDILPVRKTAGGISAVSGYPRVNLWPDSARRLFGSPDTLPRIAPDWDKRYWDLSTHPDLFARDAAPLRAVYVLSKTDGVSGCPQIEPVPPAQGVATLAAYTYANYLLDAPARLREFESLSQIVMQVPVRVISTPALDDCSKRVSEVILADAVKLPN
jgi:hypothetical protein